jgi:uncharacterized protein
MLVALYWLLVVVMVAGVIGAALPAVPGTSIILAAIVVWGFVLKDFSLVAWPLGVAIAVLVFSFGIDFLAGYWGAEKAGASKWGQIGSVVGMVVGFFGLLPALPFGGPIVGLMLGPLVGAFVGEFLYCKDVVRSAKAGIGIVVGTILGCVMQGILAIAPVVVFIVTTINTIPR